ncbi:hypothetical protein N8I43_001452 [Salmonella enterica]|uniref:Uncharacterized protein n=1 Tax=Salmonella enterica subsp. houtenae serovar 44:z4,z24:- TaxID=1967610 RepID=A0A737NPS8_SALHO|nr:hypothetical protein [Salmonella enterica]EKO7483739.1 hypothetical protein [Salmonella enterica]HAE7153845.1 hypothetical protein [Salmonella enterica subsp. houtenae serovar 44:z4,z24:-]HAE8349853.1 hypothetical protein [Salmonella enterica subsp. houtenae serovar 44:z4,z24:-]
MYYHALKLSRPAMLALASLALSGAAIAADLTPTPQIVPTAQAYIVSHPDKVGEVVHDSGYVVNGDSESEGGIFAQRRAQRSESKMNTMRCVIPVILLSFIVHEGKAKSTAQIHFIGSVVEAGY